LNKANDQSFFKSQPCHIKTNRGSSNIYILEQIYYKK
jgi:hypothetical protein